MVVVESDLLPPDPAVVVIPLIADYPAVKELNPEVQHDGKRWVLATRLIAAVRRSSLRRAGSVADQGDRINRDIEADLVAELEAVGHGASDGGHAHGHAVDLVFFNPIGQRGARESHNPQRRQNSCTFQ